MKKQFWIGLILLPLLLAVGCNGGFKTSEKGLVYKFLEGDALKKPYGPHHFMLLNHMLIGPQGDTLENSFLSDTLDEFSKLQMAPQIATRKYTEGLNRIQLNNNRISYLIVYTIIFVFF